MDFSYLALRFTDRRSNLLYDLLVVPADNLIHNRFMTNLKRILVHVSVFAALLLCLPASAFACPTCKEALSGSTSVGFAFAILLMMAMPFFIAACWVVAIFRLRSGVKDRNPTDALA